jgi:hypothetical protein
MGDIPRGSSSSEIADTLACLERLEDADLIAIRGEMERICRQKGILGESRRPQKLVKLGAVSLGDTFIYRTIEIWGGNPFANNHKCPVEGMVLKVIGFPRYLSQVVVEDRSGCKSLLSFWEVERALRLHPIGRQSKIAAELDSSPRQK